VSTTGLSGTAGLDGSEMAETAGTSNCGVRSATACRDGVGGDAGRVTGRSGAGAGALATSPFGAGDCCFRGEGSGVVARISRLVTVWGSAVGTVVLTSRSGSADVNAQMVGQIGDVSEPRRHVTQAATQRLELWLERRCSGRRRRNADDA